MKTLTLSTEAKKAVVIGSMCSLSYLAVYVAKNVLSASSPQMVESGVFTNEQIGTLSSVYFITYAVGQLINGQIGDRVKSKYMISIGLVMAGVCSLLFSAFSGTYALACVTYGMIGYFLSMIYGSLTKVVAENTEPPYTTRCSLGYTVASFFGTPLAGLLAAFLMWRWVFNANGGILMVMGCVCFTVFTLFERTGFIRYGRYKRQKGSGGGVRVLIKRRIIKFILISALTGVVRTSVVFWLPTYLSQHLGFSAQSAAMIFTAATLVISATPFAAIFLYERMGHDMDRTILTVFSSSALCFLSVFFLKAPVANIVVMILAIMSSNSAASMLWSRYCPSLRDTGMVASATGFLDFISYMAASISSKLFANAATSIGWGNLILVWFGLMICGIVVALPYHKIFKRHTV